MDTFRIACIDLDGTLLNNKHLPSEDTVKQLQHLERQGFRICIATGRSSPALVGTAKLLQLEGDNYCGGAADIWKLFDQIRRPLVYKMAAAACMPTRILGTYRRYQEGRVVHNSLAGGTGQPYMRPASIPQGALSP